MRLAEKGVVEIAAPIARVWERLLDAEYVASCAPGIESMEPIDATHFRAVAALGVGSVKVRFTLAVELADLDPPRSARMVVRGESPGSALRAESSARLESTGDASTRLSWTIDSSVHGTLASVGARLLAGTAKRLSAAFWKKFAAGAGAPAPRPVKSGRRSAKRAP